MLKKLKRWWHSICKHHELKVYKQLFETNMRVINTHQGILNYIESQEAMWTATGQDLTQLNMVIIRKLKYEQLIFEGGELKPHPRLEK